MGKEIFFKSRDNITLHGIIYEPLYYETAILYLHGFPGRLNKIGRTFCRTLSVLGYLTMSFDFRGIAPSEGKFEDKLLSREVEDIGAAIDFLHENYNFKRLFVIGASAGAVDATLYAHKDKRIHGLVLLSGISDLKTLAAHQLVAKQIEMCNDKGYVVYDLPGKWYHKKTMKKAFYDEFFTLDVQHSLHRFRRPILIVHGEKDEEVPVTEAYQLYETANEPKQLVIIPGADHTFSSVKYAAKVLWQIIRFVP